MKKKITLVMLAMVAMLMGKPVTATAQNYDFSKVNWTDMLEVFYKALANNKPYPTDAEIEALGIPHADLQFIKSHVDKRTTVSDDNRLIGDTYAGRKLWMNTPMGSGSGGDAGYPTGVFHSDVFSLWNYVSLWGSWNHSICQIPGAWTDAAHKNGCDMLGGTIFFDGYSTLYAKTQWTTRANSVNDQTPANYKGYKYVKPLIHMLLYFGVDGVNINWELGSPSETKSFHKALYSYAKEIGFKNFHLGLYTVQAYLTHLNVDYLYTERDGQVADIMLNYGGEYSVKQSAQTAKNANAGLGASGVWQGFWIKDLDKSWSYMNDGDGKEVNFCLWGEHKDSRFWSYNSGAGAMNQQENYQSFLERAFSGGNRNPIWRPAVSSSGNKMEWDGATPPLKTFAGFSNWIPERSTVTGKFPFYTNFNLGNGERYNYRGKKTAGGWYNISAQDVVPTYRWLVLKANQTVSSTAEKSTSINAAFSHEDAFIGGSCLRLTGDASQPTDIVLYNTDITPNDAATYALVAIKGAGDRGEGVVESHLSLILFVNNAWKEYQIPNNNGKSWQEHRIALNLKATDKVEKIGLRVQGGDDKYDMYVGKIELNDGHKAMPVTLANLTAEKKGETPSTMDLKLCWDVNVVPNAYGLGLNSTANIDHFEILVKDGESGIVREVGRTSQWAAFVPAVEVAAMQHPYIGVVAVSTDLKTVGEPLWKAVDKDPNVEEDPFGTYGESTADKNAEGYQTALKCRAVESFRTENAEENINFSQTYEEFKAERDATGGLQYHKVKGKTLKVRQGTTIDFWLKGFDGDNSLIGSDDDFRYCFVGGWMDLDGSGTFNYGKGMKEQPFWLNNNVMVNGKVYANGIDGEENFPFDNSTMDGTEKYGERVFRAGTLRKGNPCLVKVDGLHGKIEIPDDARRGPSRLRIVYSDAWFAGAFGPVGKTNKGYTLDIDVVIVGDNDNERGSKDLHDTGEVDDWTVITDITDVNKDEGIKASVRVEGGNFMFTNTKKAEIYTPNGLMVKSLTRPNIVAGKGMVKGVYLVRLNGGKTVKVVL